MNAEWNIGDTTRRATALCVLFLIGTAQEAAAADTPRAIMRDATSAYAEERYQEAADAFRVAAERAAEEDLDPARARYNYANALYQDGRFEEAAVAYHEALRSTDLDVQQSAHFNRGNALLANAQRLAAEQELDTAKTMTERALDSYRNALLLQPDDRDAKINYELADRFREELEMQIAQQPPQPQPQSGDEEDQEQQEEQDDEAPPEPQPSPEEDGEDEQQEEPTPSYDAETTPADASAQDISPESMEEMTEEEAMLLLDAMRDEEQEARDQMRLRLGNPAEVEKDW